MFKNVYYDNQKNKMHLWEIGENGKTVYSCSDHEIYYYIEDKTKKSPIKDIYGTPVIKQIAKDKKTIKMLKESGVKLFESDLNEEVKFLHERYKDEPDNINYEHYNVYNLDIENEYPDSDRINLIGLQDMNTGFIYQFGLHPYTPKEKNVKYIHCETEELLISSFCKFLKFKKIDILTGWNIAEFDIPKIQERIDLLEIDCSMSPIGKIKRKKTQIQIAGIQILDMMVLYKKFAFKNHPSFSLNYISNEEIQEGKLEFEGSLNTLWKTDWDTFCLYNGQDLDLLRKLENKLKYIKLAILFGTQTRTPFERVSSTIPIVEGYMIRYLHRENIVMSDNPNIGNGEEEDDETIEGGYVFTIPGFYNFMMSYDATSLYPSDMRMFNISPETKVLNPKNTDGLISTPIPGLYYKKEQGILPKIITDIFIERKKYQKLMKDSRKNNDYENEIFYDSQQLIRKILINSMYGVLCNKYFHYFDIDNAGAVTAIGRDVIKYISKCVNVYLSSKEFVDIAKQYYPSYRTFNTDIKDYVRTIDTDSVYIWIEHIYKNSNTNMSFMEFSLDLEKNILTPYMEKCMNDYAKKHNTDNLIFFKREKIILKMYVQAKKKYLTYIIANEDKVYDKPEMKITGIEINRSDLCKFSKERVRTLANLMFEGDKPNKDKMLQFIRNTYQEFKKQNIEDIATPKAVKNYTKYEVPLAGDMTFLTKTPVHNKASLIYNLLIKEANLPYTEIKNGTKMKFVFINQTMKSNKQLDCLKNDPVVGFVGNYPKEFQEWFNIDFDEQFKTQFLNIAQRMFDTLGFGEIVLKTSKLSSILDEEDE